MKRLTGKLEAARIRLMQTPRPPEGLIDRIRALGCDTSLISHAMNDLGLSGTLPASRCRSTIAGTSVVVPAVAVGNIPARGASGPRARAAVKDGAHVAALPKSLP